MPDFHVVKALTLRYLYLYSRNWVRLIELLFWPIMELLVWGNLTIYLQKHSDTTMPQTAIFLIGGLILWDVLFRAQQGVAISFLEDVWTRNLLNVFVAPVRTTEYVLSTFAIGFIRILITVCALIILSRSLYQFDILILKGWLPLYFANLMIFGWSLGMISTALILRWGQAAESLAWAVPFLIQPLAAVFYPVSILPNWAQTLALSMPVTHVFEGMRAQINGTSSSLSHLFWASTLNLLYLIITGAFFALTLNRVKKHGLLVKVATH